jgi:hypothetical protein
MGFTNALFYPTIDIHNEEWLKNAVLFWDKINTIVPESIENPYNNKTTSYLEEIGILNPINVNSDDVLIEELTNDTINYLNTNEGFQLLSQGRTRKNYQTIHRDKLPRDVQRLFRIHPEKLSSEIQYQLRQHRSDEWFEVDGNFAYFYMTLLANKVSERKSIALLSDNYLTSNLSDLARLNNQIAIQNVDYNGNNRRQQMLNLAPGLLVNLIIKSVKISELTEIDDLIKFKKVHSDELGLFRSNIVKLTKDIPKESTPEQIKQLVHDIYIDDFLPSYNNLKKSLDSSGIKWTADNIMKIAFFSVPATAIPMALGLSLPEALLAGVGVSLFSSVVAYNEDKKQTLRNNPYSYLLAINNNI